MKEVFKSVREWCRAIAAERHRKKVLRREKEIRSEAMRRVQVMEYGGELYFCFDGIPLLHSLDLTHKMGIIVRDARDTFADYRITQELQGEVDPHRV